MKPLCIDLFCGLGGWAEGFLAEGWEVIGYDIERHVYESDFYPGVLILQSVLDLQGAIFRNADMIVASPPCQEFSYMAMPWKRGKQIAAALRGQGEFPTGYSGSRNTAELTRLFDACFRIHCEACEAAGRHIPMVVENVRGAQPWVGRAVWNYGSFYLWGDVPAIMPFARTGPMKYQGSASARLWKDRENPRLNQGHAPLGTKTTGHVNKRDGHTHTRHLTNQAESDAVKGMSGLRGMSHPTDANPRDLGGPNDPRRFNSRSQARKAASAQIAKIPFALASHIARVYKPDTRRVAA